MAYDDDREIIRQVFESDGDDDAVDEAAAEIPVDIERIRFEGISSRAFEHPRDRAALDALRKTPALPTVLKAVFGNLSERSLRLLYLAHAVRVGEDQFPRIHGIFSECCEVFDMPEKPELYIAQTPLINAGAIGMDKPFIVLNSGTVEFFDDGELRFVMGHELGHILSGHVLYKTLLKTALRMTLPMFARIGIPIAGLAVHGLLYALLDWDRHSEFTGDRAGLLCAQSPRIGYRALMKTAGGSMTDEMSVEAFLRQAAEYEAGGDMRDSALKLLNLLGRSHPFPVLRVAELSRWVDSGGYQGVMSGDYPRRAENAGTGGDDQEVIEWRDDGPDSRPVEDPLQKFFSSIASTVAEKGQAIRDQVRNLMDGKESNDRPGSDDSE